MTTIHVTVVNNFARPLRVSVNYRESDLVSSQTMRISHSECSQNSHTSTSVGGGWGILGSAKASISSGMSASSSAKSENASGLDWHWSRFILPGSVFIRPRQSLVFTVLNDKPIHYLTVIDNEADAILCEHFPTDATRIEINSRGRIVPNIEFIDISLLPALRETVRQLEQTVANGQELVATMQRLGF